MVPLSGLKPSVTQASRAFFLHTACGCRRVSLTMSSVTNVFLTMHILCAMICEATAGAVSPRKKRTRPRCLQTTMRRSFVHSTYRDHCMLAGATEVILLEYQALWLLLTGGPAAIATDVCANISPPPMSGLVFLSSLPSVAPEVLFTVATPTVVGLQPGLNTTSDAALYAQTKIDLIDSLFADPDNVPFALKTSLIGQSVMQRAALGGVLLSRAQDPAKLFEAGKAGMPLLILHGTGDKIMSGDGAVKALTPHFSDMDVRMYEGAGHALFHDKQDEVITEILVFLKRIGEKTK